MIHSCTSFRGALLLASLCSLSLCDKSSAGTLNTETKQAYQLQVVLRIAPHQLLTAEFAQQVKRELQTGLQLALGTQGNVEVTVEDHPFWKDAETIGLQAALDAYKNGGKPGKTHFVLVDYVDGYYEIQAGQYDGQLGLCSPVVQRARTEDREFVARTATLLVDRNFAPVGTIVNRTTKEGKVVQVQMVLRGSEIPGASRDHWVKKDDVFMIAQVRSDGPVGAFRQTAPQVTQRVPDAFLQVIEPSAPGGVCLCRLLARHATDAAKLVESGNILGYRCMKLETTEAPLRLRLLDEKGLPARDLQVEVNRFDFAAGKEKSLYSPDREGYVQTTERYNHLTYVKVVHGGRVVALIPVPILEGNIPSYKVRVDEKLDLQQRLTNQRNRCLKYLIEHLQAQNDASQELSALLGDAGKKEEAMKQALEKARAALDLLNRDLPRHREDLEDLIRELTNHPECRIDVGPLHQCIAQLTSRKTSLDRQISVLEETQKLGPLQKEFQILVLQARAQRAGADYETALKFFDQALAKADEAKVSKKDRDTVKQERDTLAGDWLPLKGADHEEARKFIYEDWARAKDDPTKIRARVENARKMFLECKRVEDKLTLNKLLLVNLDHLKMLTKKMEDNKSLTTALTPIADSVQKLYDDVSKYLNPNQQASK